MYRFSFVFFLLVLVRNPAFADTQVVRTLELGTTPSPAILGTRLTARPLMNSSRAAASSDSATA